MLILNRDEVSSLLAMGPLIDALETGFARLSAGEVVQPQRLVTPVAPHDGLHLSMPVYVGGDDGGDLLAIKVVTAYARNQPRHGLPTVQAVLLLHDAGTGRTVACMNAEPLTTLRTGAASGVATRHLARAGSSTLLMIGCGALAFHQIEAVCAVRPIQRVLVCSRTGVKDEALCRRVREHLSREAAPMPIADAVPLADVICTATTARRPLFDDALVRPGCHINAVGAYTPAMRELSAETLRRARVFVDRREAARAEAGDLIQAAGSTPVTDWIAGELGDVVRGAANGREDEAQVTVFKSVGLAMQDAVAASLAYAAALRRGIGQRVEMG